jgi:hypothetical protein
MSSYPGNRRVAQPAYTPNSNEYKQIDAHTAVAQAHFVTCPGGNALRLMSGTRDETNYMHPMEKVGATGAAAPPTYISGERTEIHLFVYFFHTVYCLITLFVSSLLLFITVTLPPGVASGDIIHVKAPDGRLNAIVIPEGMGPGSTFTVEFANNDSAPPPTNMAPGIFVPTVIAEPEVETGVLPPAFSYANYNNNNNNGAMSEQAPVAQPISAMQMNAAYAPK